MSPRGTLADRPAAPLFAAAVALSSLFLLLLPAGAALAQTPAPDSGAEGASAAEVFEDSVEVRLVELDVQVLDPKGHPVTGLAKEDFELLVDGEPVPVEFFGGKGAAAPERLGAAEKASG
ncbi:MAG: hypothetical protein MI919_24185, partial [Holophagales bacterium]|nr:hypothetical protein [Holophagales bacterium]